MTSIRISIASIRRDGGTQARMTMDRAAVEEYSERMKEGVVFPPVHVFCDSEDTYWLADGFHRVEAASLAGLEEIEAVIQSGGLRDARLFALGANATHGIRRTNADKRMAVNMLLQDEEWSQWSNREIARRCGVSTTFVDNMRREGVQTVCTPKVSFNDTDKTSKKTVKQPIEQEVEPETIKSEAVEKPSDPPSVETVAGASEPVAHPAEPCGNPGELEALRAENEELKDRLHEVASILADTQEELEAARRALDAEDLLAQFDKEIKRAQAQAHVVQSRNNGLMNENADLKGRLKSALRKIERLESAMRETRQEGL